MEHPPAWPLHEGDYNPFVSPTAHYFNNGGSPRETAYMQYPITLDEKRPLDSPDMNLPQMPPRATLHRESFYASGEDVLGPHIVTGRPQKKFRKRFDWRAGVQRLYKSWVDNWWLWELLSWCVSAICMGVIGLVLLLLDDKPTGANDFTLNSIISILSGIAKAALLLPTAEALGQLKWSWFWRDSKKVRDFETFDQASRGPWGSLMLLIRTKGKTIATAGAVITILSIAVDPFFQQLVIFPQRWVRAEGNATMPQLQNFDGSEVNVTMGGKGISSADPLMIAFMEPLLSGHEIDPRVPLNCPTSNCTWEPFDSLSVCTACHDVSDMLQYACLDTKIEWLSNVTNISDASGFPTARTCGFFLNATSDDPILMTGYVSKGGDHGLQEVLVSRQFPLTDVDTLQTFWDGSIHFKERVNPIIDYISVSAPNGVPSVYGNATPVAQECVINWCTKKFNMTYFIGNLTQNVIGEPVMQTGEAPFPWKIVGEVEGNPDYNYIANFTFEPPGQNLTFSLSNQTMFETIILMMEFFPAFLTGRSDLPHLLYRFYNMAAMPHPWIRSIDANPFQNITDLNDRIGAVMTNVLLTSFTGANLRVGTAWDLVVYVNVRWIWMSLPFALLFFSLIFLLATIFKSADEVDDIGIWKTSALAVLLNGLRGDVQAKMGTPNQMGEARTNADNVRVKLMFTKKGRYRLSGVSGPWNLSPDDALHGKTWI